MAWCHACQEKKGNVSGNMLFKQKPYKKFIENVSEQDFPQGKTNNSAVIFPIEQISTLVTTLIQPAITIISTS